MDVSGNMMGTVQDEPVVGLDLVAERALVGSDSALAIIGFPTEDGNGLYCAASAGPHGPAMTGRTLSLTSPVISGVLGTGESQVVADSAEILGAQDGEGFGPALLAALGPQGTNQGVLILARQHGAGTFSLTDIEMSAVFGSHVALALELARAHRLREQLVVFKDRDRIAMDLHDVVIQRLFAAGLSTQSLRRFTTDQLALQRISAVTGELDETIRELRDTIYSLRGIDGEHELLTSRIHWGIKSLVGAVAPVLESAQAVRSAHSQAGHGWVMNVCNWKGGSNMVTKSAVVRNLRLGAAAVLLAVLGGAAVAQPAWADGGQSAAEGYVMVQQALSFLVNDTGPDGTAQALVMVDDALAAKDQDGVAVAEVRAAKTALEAGKTAEAQALLQGSITEAVAGLKPAIGEETGTTVMLGPLPPRGTLSGTDWAFLGLSLLVALAGAVLAFLFRPRESLRDLRHALSPHRASVETPSERHLPGRNHDEK